MEDILHSSQTIRPQFYFRTTDVTGVIELPEGVEMVMPGDNVEMTVELIAPIAIENGTKFSIREGGRTVGAGNVSEILLNNIYSNFAICNHITIIKSLFFPLMIFILNKF